MATTKVRGLGIGLLAGALGLATAVSGCAAQADAEPQATYVTSSSVPPNIESYPAVQYEGHPTYWVDNKWYYRRGDHWVYYREEPNELMTKHQQRQQEHEEVKRNEVFHGDGI